jgi:hypothetical protein
VSVQIFNNSEGRGGNEIKGITFAQVYKIFKDRLTYLDRDYDPDAVCQNACVEIEKAMGIYPSPYRIPPAKSVLQDWVSDIPLRHQGVLVIALRGPDGVRKEDPAKPLVRTIRGMVMNAGRTGKPMEPGVEWRDDPFMSIAHIWDLDRWELTARAFFDQWDAYNVHFLQHLAHAFGVIGNHYPDMRLRDYAWLFYERCCRKLHMTPETKEEMCYRLRDGIREEDGKHD